MVGLRVATGLGLIFSIAIGMLYIAQIDTLQDSGETLTTGPLQQMWQAVTPITMIVLAGFIAVGTCFALFRILFTR